MNKINFEIFQAIEKNSSFIKPTNFEKDKIEQTFSAASGLLGFLSG